MKNLILAVILLGLCGTADAAPQFKFCFIGLTQNGKFGCYNGSKNVDFEEWLSKAEPRAKLVKVEMMESQSGRPPAIAKIWWEWK